MTPWLMVALEVEWTESWGKRVDGLFAELFAYIQSFKAFIQSTLTLDELGLLCVFP